MKRASSWPVYCNTHCINKTGLPWVTCMGTTAPWLRIRYIHCTMSPCTTIVTCPYYTQYNEATTSSSSSSSSIRHGSLHGWHEWHTVICCRLCMGGSNSSDSVTCSCECTHMYTIRLLSFFFFRIFATIVPVCLSSLIYNSIDIYNLLQPNKV